MAKKKFRSRSDFFFISLLFRFPLIYLISILNGNQRLTKDIWKAKKLGRCLDLKPICQEKERKYTGYKKKNNLKGNESSTFVCNCRQAKCIRSFWFPPLKNEKLCNLILSSFLVLFLYLIPIPLSICSLWEVNTSDNKLRVDSSTKLVRLLHFILCDKKILSEHYQVSLSEWRKSVIASFLFVTF